MNVVSFPPLRLLLRHFSLTASVLTVLLLASLVFFSPSQASASEQNRLYRIDIRQGKDYTRLTMRLAAPPQYTLSLLPGDRLRLVIGDTGGTLFRKFKTYSDKNIGGLVIKRRGECLLVTFRIAKNVGWRDLTRPEISAITLDVGVPFKSSEPRLTYANRERIWNGIGKLVRDFDPPLKSEIPFSPTDRQILAQILDEQGQKEFMSAETALYKGSLTQAEEIFTRFSARQTQVRALALYRLAETWYKLQKYSQSLAAFREAEKIWPAYLGLNLGANFYYGDSIARSGNLEQARFLLAGLVAKLADRAFAPALLVRLGDILSRQGHESEARAIYSNVSAHFKEHKASRMAAMRVADGQFLQATPWNYLPIRDVYFKASQQSSDLDMREESHFKYVLLDALHGEAAEALQQVMGFQRKFPRGVYAAVAWNMREVLVGEVYRTTSWSKEPASLVRFTEEHNDYLGECAKQPGFVAAITRAYNEAGRPIELVKMLSFLAERPWAASVAPELYVGVVDSSELIGDNAAAERAIKTFLSRFPKNPLCGLMTERLGSIYFVSEQHQKVKDTLMWLLDKKSARAQRAVSYYQLGRSLWALQAYSQAARSMDLYLMASVGREDSLLPDAYFVAGAAREGMGDPKGALRIFDAALALRDNKRHEEFLYRAGQLNLRQGNVEKAKNQFSELAEKGKDPDWQKLAQQALASLEEKSSR